MRIYQAPGGDRDVSELIASRPTWEALRRYVGGRERRAIDAALKRAPDGAVVRVALPADRAADVLRKAAR